MTNLLWTLGAIAVCAGMFFIAARMEPHWVAKDGTRFITTSQLIDRFGETIGRRREVRAAILPDGSLLVSRRSIIKTTSGVWRIQAKSPNPPKGRHIYLLREIPPDPDGELLALRVPASSKIVPALDAITPDIDPSDPRVVSVPTPHPGTRRWARRADPH
jgi:hypothetical protein